MNLKQTPELKTFLAAYFPEADPENDDETIAAFGHAATPERLQAVVAQARALAAAPELPLEEIGMESNRWFASADEARAWFERIVAVLSPAEGAGTEATGLVVKDSSGTALAEGDSVTVIKDLKVKGGSSDLKRGTLIKKIHLVDDPEVVECRVDGSTLVLKTCFLRKA